MYMQTLFMICLPLGKFKNSHQYVSTYSGRRALAFIQFIYNEMIFCYLNIKKKKKINNNNK